MDLVPGDAIGEILAYLDLCDITLLGGASVGLRRCIRARIGRPIDELQRRLRAATSRVDLERAKKALALRTVVARGDDGVFRLVCRPSRAFREAVTRCVRAKDLALFRGILGVTSVFRTPDRPLVVDPRETGAAAGGTLKLMARIAGVEIAAL